MSVQAALQCANSERYALRRAVHPLQLLHAEKRRQVLSLRCVAGQQSKHLRRSSGVVGQPQQDGIASFPESAR
jgi:hypothetical protein